MATRLQTNNTNLQQLLNTINSLPVNENLDAATVKIQINWNFIHLDSDGVGYFDAEGNGQWCTETKVIEALGGIVYAYFGTAGVDSYSGDYSSCNVGWGGTLLCFHSDGGSITIVQSDEPL